MSDFLDQAALRAMSVLLQQDLQECVENQRGPEWVAKIAYEVAQAMNAERTITMTRLYDGQ
jgi:hypothetical protein